jgi:hypothetical protein
VPSRWDASACQLDATRQKFNAEACPRLKPELHVVSSRPPPTQYHDDTSRPRYLSSQMFHQPNLSSHESYSHNHVHGQL